ncbi:uncharacterized protein LOC126736718 [Anthonomus grandis grandis]|uniref:uncharacterized protein LOC126736718 n=1 Tax=Anthonomus grandis grandis TaxID=2921223 RepID=UPI00216632D7|nr:uncharacterized protein LOC126736718 [Anthonomus grandis grandis]
MELECKSVKCRITGEKKLIEVFQEIMNCPESYAKSIRQADAFKRKLDYLEFVFLLNVFSDIFQQTELLYNVLQKKNNDIQLCNNSVSRCLKVLKSWRNDLTFSKHINVAVSETNTELTLNRNELGGLPKNDGNQSTLDKAKTKFRRIFFEILDNNITQLEQRFSDQSKFQFLQLSDTKKFPEYGGVFPQKPLDSLINTYEALFDKSLLKTELETIFSPIHREQFYDKSLLGLIKSMHDNDTNEILPESYKLFCLLATIPATSASVERTFSTLKRIKTSLRNTMTQNRLSSLSILSIQKDILAQLVETGDTFYDRVIDKFARNKDRRINLLYR